jgi:hypothetical protein
MVADGETRRQKDTKKDRKTEREEKEVRAREKVTCFAADRKVL